MSDFNDLCDEALEAWSYVREGVIAEIENLPAERLDERPRPESRTPVELGVHIARSGLLMAGELARPDGDFTRAPYPELLDEHSGEVEEPQSRDELIALMRETHRKAASTLRRAGEERLLDGIRRFDGKVGTRLAWMYHGIAHEEYHRGQLALYARLFGVVPALTKTIQGG